MRAADSGALLVAHPAGVETPRQRRPGLQGDAVHTATAKGPARGRGERPCVSGVPAQVAFRRSVD